MFLLFAAPAMAANHSFTGLPLDSNGFTDFESIVSSGYGSARVVFVSSATGNDTDAANNITSNGHYGVADVTFDEDGVFQAPVGVEAFTTISAAYAYCRDGLPDILLLERDGEWSAGRGVDYVNSGSAQSTPHIIASYGSGARPKLTDVEFNSSSKSHIVVSSIHFYSADWTTADRALDIRGTATNQLFEDLYIEQTAGDIVQGASVDTIVFRRCIWINNEAHDGQMYMSDADNVILEENIFAEPYDDSYGDESRYGRHLYFAHGESNGTVARGNVFFASDREGADFRAGGEIYNNLIVQSYLRVGDVGTSTRYTCSGDIYQNVLMEGSPQTGTATIILILANDGSNIYDNIVTNPTNATTNVIGISVIGNYSSTPALPTAKNLNIYDNVIYDWAASGGNGIGIRVDSSLTDIENLSIHDNDIQMINGHGGGAIVYYPTDLMSYVTFANNRYYSTEAEADWFDQGDHDAWVSASSETGSTKTEVSYTAPTRTVGSYHGTIGGVATTAAFMTAVLAQSRTNWDDDLMATSVINYIRAGFDMEPVSTSYSASTTFSGAGSVSMGGAGTLTFWQ
jgi:hypothetical protein